MCVFFFQPLAALLQYRIMLSFIQVLLNHLIRCKKRKKKRTQICTSTPPVKWLSVNKHQKCTHMMPH